MKNLRPLTKRVCAYIIDLFVVLIIASIISSIPIFNKNIEEYQKTYSEYEEEYNKYNEYLKLLEENFKDNKINEEEYKKLIKNKEYSNYIINRYSDSKISKGEYKQIIIEINKEFDKTITNYVYILNKKGVSNSIIVLLCTLIYFGILQYFLKGQTIGKKILKLKVVSVLNKKINILNYILRSLIVNNILLNGIGIIFLLTTSKSIYNQANNILSILISVSEAIIIFLVLTRTDQRGLHDLLFNTKVISTVSVDNLKKESISKDKNKVIEAIYHEEGIENGKERSKKTNRRKN